MYAVTDKLLRDASDLIANYHRQLPKLKTLAMEVQLDGRWYKQHKIDFSEYEQVQDFRFVFGNHTIMIDGSHEIDVHNRKWNAVEMHLNDLEILLTMDGQCRQLKQYSQI